MADNKEAFGTVSKILKVKNLHGYQKECLLNVFNGKDCFICQPAGSGKSISYQAIPFACQLFERNDGGNDMQSYSTDDCSNIVLVISPLTALMNDQVLSLKKKKINAICMVQKDGEVHDMEVQTNKQTKIFS